MSVLVNLLDEKYDSGGWTKQTPLFLVNGIPPQYNGCIYLTHKIYCGSYIVAPINPDALYAIKLY